MPEATGKNIFELKLMCKNAKLAIQRKEKETELINMIFVRLYKRTVGKTFLSQETRTHVHHGGGRISLVLRTKRRAVNASLFVSKLTEK